MILNKIIIWGHKLHSHTHSYIHDGFFKAFKHLGYDIYWFDKDDDIINFDFSNSFFLTDGLSFSSLPIRNDCFYFLHNVNGHDKIPIERKLIFQVYTHDCIGRDEPLSGKKYHYYKPPPHNTIYFPWATDLLPEEIEKNKTNLDKIVSSKDTIVFIGMTHGVWGIVKSVCSKYNFKFFSRGGTFDKNSTRNVSSDNNMKLIQKSLIALSFQSDWQVKNGYIPCRIFKNISYGRMGITNSSTVNNLFDNKLIYDSNIENAIKKGIMFEERKDKRDIVIYLMNEVKNKHTYLNRIEIIKWYMKEHMNIDL